MTLSLFQKYELLRVGGFKPGTIWIDIKDTHIVRELEIISTPHSATRVRRIYQDFQESSNVYFRVLKSSGRDRDGSLSRGAIVNWSKAYMKDNYQVKL